MGITSAFYSGVSGLNTNSQAMTVIGNNLANTNTVGFKGSRHVFADLLSGTINGSGGSSQVGKGVGVSTMDTMFSQGTFETTESNLDCAIEGDGFFILREEGDQTSYYSRAGAFSFDEAGYLKNPEGLYVQGIAYDADGALVGGDPTDIQVLSTGLIAGSATTELSLETNLNADAEITVVGGLPAFASDDDTTYNYSSSTQIFDSLGNAHLMTTYFRKTDAANTWSTAWSVEDADGLVIEGDNADTLVFNEDGILVNDTLDPAVDTTFDIVGIDWANDSALTNVTVTFNTTQFNSDSEVLSQDQNGYGSGSLTGVEIDGEGNVAAFYSNGESENIAQLVLAKFVNTGGLSAAGSNLFTATTESGTPRVGIPGPELGSIFTNSLEQSNVDMGVEFVRMMTVQKGFEASSKIITTVDELLDTVINLKR